MCTSISFNTTNHFFGRNLDVTHSYSEAITITPRNFPFHFRCYPDICSHYAIIGMAVVINDYPLYFDATNEVGLSIAGLNFPDNAHYFPFKENMDNITPYELIPWILSTCSSVEEVKIKLSNINLLDMAFNENLPLTPLHWHIADKHNSITLESTKEGVMFYDNPTGVLTNNPPFPIQLFNLNNYMNLSVAPPKNTFSSKLPLSLYSLGLGSLGLPGDYSSMSRFVKATFVKSHMEILSQYNMDVFLQSNVMTTLKTQKEPVSHLETVNVSQFFHILYSVAMPFGLVLTEQNDYEYTSYSSCCNTDTGIYYYTTYLDRSIKAVAMNFQDLDSCKLIVHPLN